jgi:hypothetical protein
MIRERAENSVTICVLTLTGLLLLIGLRLISVADEKPLPAYERRERDARAGKLVEEALRKRIVGTNDEVRELAALAVTNAPDFAPARWLHGEVRRNGRWMSLEEIQKQSAESENLAEYGRQRDGYARLADPIWLNHPPHVAAAEAAPDYMHRPRKSTRYLRKSFVLSDKPQFAQLQLRIQGKAEVFLNGHHMMQSKSAWLSGIEKASDQLRNGKNVIAVSIRGASDQQVPGIRLWLEGVSHEHRIFTIPTDGTWRVSAEAADGWRDAAFDDGHWEAAAATPLSIPEGALAVEQPISAPLEAALARWCQAHGLPEPARFHWTRLLYYQPQNADALKALGLIRYGDKLLTKEQLEVERKTERDARVALARWQPIFEKMKGDLDRGTPKAIEVARARLQEADLGAIPAFEAVLNQFAETDGAPGLTKEFIRHVLARFPDREATEALSRLAKDHSQQAVRDAAIEALKPRDLLDFVPPLMGALQSPTDVEVMVAQEPEGIVVCSAKYFHKGVDVDDERTETFRYDAREEAESRNGTASAEARQAAWRRATLKKAEIETTIVAQNLAIDRSNERLLDILRQVTGLDHGPAPAWWRWWRDYNELLIPKNPVRATSFYNTELIRYDGSRRVTEKDCFSRGTPVWTLGGLRPIETIKLGDPVLAQDPETGELAFKVVLGTSIRPASPMVRLRVGDEMITSTRGHRYWKEGHGWRMAKNLAAGDKLHSVDRSLSVDEVLATPDEPAWNLVVDGFNSYFVGRQAILVHDTGAPRPTTALVPGLHR